MFLAGGKMKSSEKKCSRRQEISVLDWNTGTMEQNFLLFQQYQQLKNPRVIKTAFFWNTFLEHWNKKLQLMPKINDLQPPLKARSSDFGQNNLNKFCLPSLFGVKIAGEKFR